MAAQIRKILLWLLGTLLTILLSSLLAWPIESWLRRKNYFEAAPEWITNVFDRLQEIAGSLAFQLMLTVIVSVAVGAWGHYLAAKHDRTAESNHATEFKIMSSAISSMLEDFWSGLRGKSAYSFDSVNEQTKISLNALYARLRRIGVKTPATEGYAQPWQYNITQIGYLQIVIQYAKSGLVPEVNAEIEAYLDTQRAAFEELGPNEHIPPKLAAEVRSSR